MKFYLPLFFTAVFLGTLNISCSKKEISSVEEKPAPQESFVNGKILSKKAELCLFGRDSQMHPVIKLYAGAEISVLEIDGTIDTKFIPDEKDVAVPADTGKVNTEISPKGTEYVHVVHDNMDFWLENSVFALNCENAVAIEKTFLYSDSALSQKINTPQNPLKFAAKISKSTTADNSESSHLNSEVSKIFYYDSEEKCVREAFVSSSSISTRVDDIVVSQIAEDLKVTKRAVPRNELFAKAAKYKPCPKVLAALNAQKEEKKTYNYQEVLKSMQRMSFGVNVDELLTVDQSKDPFK